MVIPRIERCPTHDNLGSGVRLDSRYGYRAFSAADLSMQNHSFWPINTGGGGARLNLDGFVSYSGNPDCDEPSSGCVQVFRSGAVEAVSSVLVTERDGNRFIASIAYEKEIISSVEVYLRSMQTLGVVPPVLFFISLLGVKGSFMWVGRGSITMTAASGHRKGNKYDIATTSRR